MGRKRPETKLNKISKMLIEKYQPQNIENQIIFMYAKGMITRDISSHIEEIYGFGLSETMISKITNKSLPTIEEWQNISLERVYPKAEIQKCVIHQIRNSSKYVSYKDVKELMKDLKTVYKAPTE